MIFAPPFDASDAGCCYARDAALMLLLLLRFELR